MAQNGRAELSRQHWRVSGRNSSPPLVVVKETSQAVDSSSINEPQIVCVTNSVATNVTRSNSFLLQLTSMRCDWNARVENIVFWFSAAHLGLKVKYVLICGFEHWWIISGAAGRKFLWDLYMACDVSIQIGSNKQLWNQVYKLLKNNICNIIQCF